MSSPVVFITLKELFLFLDLWIMKLEFLRLPVYSLKSTKIKAGLLTLGFESSWVQDIWVFVVHGQTWSLFITVKFLPFFFFWHHFHMLSDRDSIWMAVLSLPTIISCHCWRVYFILFWQVRPVVSSCLQFVLN